MVELVCYEGALDIASEESFCVILSLQRKAEAIDGLEMATFVEIASLVLEDVSLEALYHGNIDLPEAKMVAELIEGMVTSSGCGALPRKKLFYQYVSKLPLSEKPVLVCAPSKDLESGNTAVEIYFQIGKDSLADRVIIDMLIQLMNEPLYTQLRTKESYGYRVSCDSRWSVGVMGIKFIVVTASKSAVRLLCLVLIVMKESPKSPALFLTHILSS